MLQPPPGDFRYNDVTSGSLRSRGVTWARFLSRDRRLLQVSALNELKSTQN